MVPRPRPTRVMHFTHLRNLGGVLSDGLRSDAVCRAQGLTEVQVGDLSIRERRLSLHVPCGPRGYVGDYVPFYFGPKSPMMFRLLHNDDDFRESYDDIVYLVTTVEAVEEAGKPWVASSRNAALALADFTDAADDLDEHVSWDVIAAGYWVDHVDGKDRRMAEFLVHDHVPWAMISEVVVRSSAAEARVSRLISAHEHQPPVIVRPGWYF